MILATRRSARTILYREGHSPTHHNTQQTIENNALRIIGCTQTTPTNRLHYETQVLLLQDPYQHARDTISSCSQCKPRSSMPLQALQAAGNASINYWSRTEWAWLRVWLSFWGSSSNLSSPHFLLCKSWGVVVMVGSCGGTDSGTYASPPSYPVFPLSLNVVNECCMKSLMPASFWKWT